MNYVKKCNMSEITLHILDSDSIQKSLQAPTDMGLSLMEFLKGCEYDILATCGGMALCATCHVEICTMADQLGEPNPDELAMLDTLPNITPTSRLSCQLRLDQIPNGMTVRIKGDGLSA